MSKLLGSISSLSESSLASSPLLDDDEVVAFVVDFRLLAMPCFLALPFPPVLALLPAFLCEKSYEME